MSEHLIQIGPEAEGSHKRLSTKEDGTKVRCMYLTHGMMTSTAITPQGSGKIQKYE
jgi:hypothetical protein